MVREKLNASPVEEVLKDYGATMRVSEVAKESAATVYRLANRGDLKRIDIQLTGKHPAVRIQKVSVVSLLTKWVEWPGPLITGDSSPTT